MSKPQLPLVPDTIKGHVYRPSGKCPTAAWLLMLGVGVPAAILIRSIGHFVGLLIPFVGAIFPGFGHILSGKVDSSFCFGIVFIAYLLTVLLASLVYPLILGGITGWLSGLVGKMGKCRSEKVSLGVGFITAMVAYFIFALTDARLSGTVHLTSRPDFLVHMWASNIETGNLSAWGYILVGLDALLFAVASSVTCWLILANPFCEICQQWYIMWQEKRVPLSLAEALLSSLSSGTLDIGNPPPVEIAHPFLLVQIKKCPDCEVSDFELRVDLVWQEEMADKSRTNKSEKSQVWFTTMIPAKLGKQLVESLVQAN